MVLAICVCTVHFLLSTYSNPRFIVKVGLFGVTYRLNESIRGLGDTAQWVEILPSVLVYYYFFCCYDKILQQKQLILAHSSRYSPSQWGSRGSRTGRSRLFLLQRKRCTGLLPSSLHTAQHPQAKEQCCLQLKWVFPQALWCTRLIPVLGRQRHADL